MSKVKRIIKTCEHCKQQFEMSPVRAEKRRFCTAKCKKAFHEKHDRLMAICKQCNKTFSYPKCFVNRVFCSTECKRSHYADAKKAVLSENRICPGCGKEWSPKSLGEARRKFCSPSCGAMFTQDKKRKFKICPTCGEYFPAPSGYTYVKFCSKKCELESHREDRTCVVCGKIYKVRKSDVWLTCVECRGKYHPGVHPDNMDAFKKKISIASKKRMGNKEYAHQISEKRTRTYNGRVIISKSGYREDLGVYVRSSWEANVLRILNYEGIRWKYEPPNCRFEVEHPETGEKRYLILDIYLPDVDIYIEVKGWEKNMEKFRWWRAQYPALYLLWVDKSNYYDLIAGYKDKIFTFEGPSKDITMAKPLSVCPKCRKSFVPRFHNQTYCCRGCYMEGRRKWQISVQVCHGCGMEFMPKRKTQKLCSQKCVALGRKHCKILMG